MLLVFFTDIIFILIDFIVVFDVDSQKNFIIGSES